MNQLRVFDNENASSTYMDQNNDARRLVHRTAVCLYHARWC